MKPRESSEEIEGTLRGRTIAFLRPRDKLAASSDLVSSLGGDPYPVDALRVTELTDRPEVKSFFEELERDSSDYTIFMSTRGVEYFIQAGEQYRPELYRDYLRQSRVIPVGPKTREELTRQGVSCHEMPRQYSSRGIVAMLAERELTGMRIAIPRSANASPVLRQGLKRLGADVKEIFLYEIEIDGTSDNMQRFLRDILRKRIDAIVLTSSAITEGIVDAVDSHPRAKELRRVLSQDTVLTAIGPQTASTLTDRELPVHLQPPRHTFRGSMTSLLAHYGDHDKRQLNTKTKT